MITRTLLAMSLSAASLLAQTGTKLIPDGGTKTVVKPHSEKKSVAVTLSPDDRNPDKKVTVRVKNSQGEEVQTYVLDGDDDGTGVFELPEGSTVEVEDTDDESANNDVAKVTVSVA